jgi:uridine kinase
MTIVTAADLAALMAAARAAPDRPIVVALDGYSGCGKSTLAAWLAESTGAVTVHCDDFYRDLTDEVRRALTPSQGVDQYFDWQRLRDEALVPLGEGRAARFRCYDWEAGGGLGDVVEVRPAEVVIVEGVYSARPELAELVDVAVYVDAPQPVRRARIAARGHGNDECNERWDAAEKVYFGQIRPPESFPYHASGVS